MQVKVNIQNIDVSKIFPNIWNPNRQSDFIFEKELTSIRTHGFLDPILVREIPGGFEIIDGEHRFKAGVKLDYKELPCNNLGKVTDSIAKQLTVILNEVKGKADTGKLSDIMKELQLDIGIEALEAIMPYSSLELDALVKSADIDWESLSPNKQEDAVVKVPPAASVEKPKADKQPEIKDQPGEEWKTLSYRLPIDIALAFDDQVIRFMKVLHPFDEIAACTPVMAIEAITQHLHQIQDDKLVG